MLRRHGARMQIRRGEVRNMRVRALMKANGEISTPAKETDLFVIPGHLRVRVTCTCARFSRSYLDRAGWHYRSRRHATND